MKPQDPIEDRPINLEDSTIIELNRAIVADDESPSTRTPEMPRKPHPDSDRRELLMQPFDIDDAT